MKELVRKRELELAYDRIMARENMQILGESGSGKSFLLNALTKRLSGRRIIFTINFTGLYLFPELVYRIRQNFENAAHQNAGLEYQLRRLNQEHPSHRIQNAEGLFDYLKALMNLLFQGGQDIVICLEDPEFCEVEDISMEELLKQFRKMSKANNIQLLLLSKFAYLKPKETLELSAPLAEDLWQEPTEVEIEALRFSRGNLSFLKAVQDHIKQVGSFKPEIFFKTHHDQFLMLKGRFTNLQWRLLRALASEEEVGQPHAFDFLVKHNLGAASSVERALRNLLDSGFIIRKGDTYSLIDPLLHRWLQYLYYQKSL